jgi:hypothetical protein
MKVHKFAVKLSAIFDLILLDETVKFTLEQLEFQKFSGVAPQTPA